MVECDLCEWRLKSSVNEASTHKNFLDGCGLPGSSGTIAGLLHFLVFSLVEIFLVKKCIKQNQKPKSFSKLKKKWAPSRCGTYKKNFFFYYYHYIIIIISISSLRYILKKKEKPQNTTSKFSKILHDHPLYGIYYHCYYYSYYSNLIFDISVRDCS
jgi:hypothetical protein